ncbi:CENP-B protein [Tuber magnatum]|uniref:CENP-B protein n=1 Tax=Tuber magnatum TaxID=42249 RepID=A0A317SD30_9PEZI|nr:CENP-B protein [Tuber magnatum]
MLILDGHGSHIQLDFLWECRQANVELLFLPAHSSHTLLPLDLGTFARLKSYYHNCIMELAQYNDAALVKKRHFVKCYQQVRDEIFNPRYLCVGWKAVVLFP